MAKTKSLAARRFELMAAEYLERMGARIRTRREELALTQEDVARQMPGKITHNRISLWERGKNRPRDDALEALAGVLGVPVSYFMMPEPDKSTTPDLSLVKPDDDRLARIEEKLEAAEAKREDLAAQIAQQNKLLARQSKILARIEGLVAVLGDAEIIELAAAAAADDGVEQALVAARQRLLATDPPARSKPRRTGSGSG